MLEFAFAAFRELLVDVNEQNRAALDFYLMCSFEPIDRIELDDQGNPHPLSHLSKSASRVPRTIC